MFGFLNVYKPQGKTSHDVVAILRRITKVKQIGHTGTLDPFAEGVLPVCIGKSTRLIEYLDDEKAYVGTIQFGKSTTTYDIEGEVVNISDKKIDFSNVETALMQFQGEIQQLPPIYSAIKVNGKKLYEYARNGETVEIKPRTVIISRLELVGFDFEAQTAKVLIECSKGTYIRSIAHDLGEALGCYGHLVKLVRTKAGKFNLDTSVKLEELNDVIQVQENLLNPLEYLNYQKCEISDLEKDKVSHGMGLSKDLPNGIVILTSENNLVAIANVEEKKVKVLKVFI